MVERAVAAGFTGADVLKEAQRLVRWHYQWVVVHDYLKRILSDELWADLVQRDEEQGEHYRLRFYRPSHAAFMPVEFSAAAFRFGHSQVRNGYALNNATGRPTFVPEPKPPAGTDLRGFTCLPAAFQVAWPNFFTFAGLADPVPSRLIDTQLVGALFGLPDAPQNDETQRNLARRNLLRGAALQLPAGEDVAEAMGVPALTQEQLAGLKVNSTDLGFNGKTPLWFYVLAEAEALGNQGQHLGPVGGRIVGETLLGMLQADRLSYLSVKPHWTPAAEAQLLPGDDEAFDLPRLLAVAAPDRTVRF